MIELVHEPFDSRLFQKNVWKLYLKPPFPDAAEVQAALARERPDMVCAFVPFAHPAIEVLRDVGFHLISIRSTYALPVTVAAESRPLDSDFRLVSLSDAPTISDNGIQDMAQIIGKTSRYFSDRRIATSQAVELYITWIRNSLFHGYATEAFLVMRGDHVVGLVTLKVRDSRGFIDLLGVASEYQRAGLGSTLMARAIQFFRSAGIQDILVVTEGENIPANAFYQRKGFHLQDLALVYHAHPTYD